MDGKCLHFSEDCKVYGQIWSYFTAMGIHHFGNPEDVYADGKGVMEVQIMSIPLKS